ncbi:MAG: hypothetical protein AAF950_08660 [Pseudomonadota bacterium]
MVRIIIIAALTIYLTCNLIASAQIDRVDEKIPLESSAAYTASLALRDGVFHPSSLNPKIDGRIGYPRIEYQMKDAFGAILAAMAIVFAQDENCLSDLHEAYRAGEDIPFHTQACEYYWAAEIVRGPVPEDQYRMNTKSLLARERWAAAVDGLESLILRHPEQPIDELIDQLPLERISVTPASCPEATPDFSGVRDMNWMPEWFLNVVAPNDPDTVPGLQFRYKDPTKVIVTVRVGGHSATAQGVPEDGNPMGWGLELMRAFQPCVEAAGYGPLNWHGNSVE